jgi:hypothetical protein
MVELQYKLLSSRSDDVTGGRKREKTLKRAVGIGEKCKGWGQLTATDVALLGETLANQRN